MKRDWLSKFLLAVIAVSLAAIALRPYVIPSAVVAQSGESRALFIEPGTSMLRAPDGSRQVLGKVVIDLRNGNVWGFPTLGQAPYPLASPNTTPPTSHPFLLGNFALREVDK